MSELDALIAKLAADQHRVLASRQLLAVGCSRNAIQRRRQDGRLHPVFRGVYAVGARQITNPGVWKAATLAIGDDAALSRFEAAALRDLQRARDGCVHVTVPGRTVRSRRGITVHVTGDLAAEDVTVIDNIPVTSVARTLFDLAPLIDERGLRRLWERAARLEILDAAAVGRLLARVKGRPGARALEALLAYDPTLAAQAESELERLFLDLIRDAGLPMPQVNVLVDGFLIDAWWPEANLVVELDGYEFHRSREAFERDRAKLARLRLAGREVVAFTHRQVTMEGAWVVEAVRTLLYRALGATLRAA